LQDKHSNVDQTFPYTVVTLHCFVFLVKKKLGSRHSTKK